MTRNQTSNPGKHYFNPCKSGIKTCHIFTRLNYQFLTLI
ncbi:hypothetical protein CDS [Salmonella enterica subsp. enterica serovar Derby]|nr:hypothetical protein CDS [Salmonella enterica subsp. enterica serovar Derby]